LTAPVVLASAALLAVLSSCGGAAPPPPPAGADLSGLDVARIRIEAVPLQVWLAETPEQQQRGLMFATAEQLAPLPDGTLRGMLFVFPRDVVVAFTMRDTYVPLDLAFVRSDGTLVEVVPRMPLDEALAVSPEPVRYALEVPRDLLADRGVGVGDLLFFETTPP
jgi:uncharacterized membrane protein (UPF0127 family)